MRIHFIRELPPVALRGAGALHVVVSAATENLYDQAARILTPYGVNRAQVAQVLQGTPTDEPLVFVLHLPERPPLNPLHPEASPVGMLFYPDDFGNYLAVLTQAAEQLAAQIEVHQLNQQLADPPAE